MLNRFTCALPLRELFRNPSPFWLKTVVANRLELHRSLPPRQGHSAAADSGEGGVVAPLRGRPMGVVRACR